MDSTLLQTDLPVSSAMNKDEPINDGVRGLRSGEHEENKEQLRGHEHLDEKSLRDQRTPRAESVQL